MGIQQWRLRSDLDISAQTSLSTDNAGDASRVTNQSDMQDAHASFFSFAALAKRGQQTWLWVVDQSDLTEDELVLLEKIKAATESSWENNSIADGYMNSQSLAKMLKNELDAIVLFGREHADFFVGQRIFVTDSVNQLMTNPERKRQTWQGLKKLMMA